MTWIGSNTVMGINAGATWDTAVAMANGTKVLMTSEGVVPRRDDIPNESLTGSRFVSPPDGGDEFHEGPVNFEADYETIHRILAFALGQAGSPASAGASTWTHTLRVPNDVEGIFATLIMGDSAHFVREYPSAKFTGFSLECEHNQRLKGSFSVACSSRNDNTTSGTNELTTLPDVTLPTGGDTNYPTFNSSFEVLVNDASSGALTGGGTDDQYVSKVTMNFQPNYRTDDVTTRYAPRIDEPLPNGEASIRGTLEFSKLQNADRTSELLNKTRKKMKWTWTGPVIASEPVFIEFWFSNVVFAEIDNAIPGKGYTPENVTFSANLAASAHTGFAHADAFYAVVQNQQSADPLVTVT